MTARFRAFLLGMTEFRSNSTTNPEHHGPGCDGPWNCTCGGNELIDAYDRGRDLAHRWTLRRWDDAR